MTEGMKRLIEAVRRVDNKIIPRGTKRQAIVEAVLQALHDETMNVSESSIHDAMVHRYTTIAVHRVLHGGPLST